MDNQKTNGRTVAYKTLLEIEKKSSYANIELNKQLERSNITKIDRSFATQLVYGVLRHQNSLDWVLEQFLKGKMAKLKINIMVILRMGVFQIMYMDKVPVSAACNESAKMARKYGHEGIVKLVNGVLRNVARNINDIDWPDIKTNPAKHISLKYSHPEWLVKRWLERFGIEGTINLCKANNKPAKTWIRCNTLKINSDKLISLLSEEGIDCQQSALVPEGIAIAGYDSIERLDSFKQGLFQVQDESSMVVGHVVKPCNDAKVIDACSAPGGKTTHMAQLMNNTGEILALDIHAHKLKLINDNCNRLGIENVTIRHEDATKLPIELSGWADLVLVDAPCSGIGVLGRRADARWKKNVQMLKELPELQLKILDSAAKCVNIGGSLIYSTCSIEPEENIQVVNLFLEKNEDFELDNILGYLPFEPDEQDMEQAKKGHILFLPQIHGTDGFFICRMRRR